MTNSDTVLVIFSVLVLLPGCITHAQQTFVVAPLLDGSSATYRTSGTPLNGVSGVYGRFPDQGGAPTVPFKDEELEVRANGPLTIIGADGLPLREATRIQYWVFAGATPYLHGEEYTHGAATVATSEWIQEQGVGNTPTHIWAKGIPDTFFVTLVQGARLTSGRMTFDVDGPDWIFWVDRTHGRLAFNVDVHGDRVSLDLDLDGIKEGERYRHAKFTWDRTCPWPTQISVVRADGSSAFQASRLSCESGNGPPAALPADDSPLNQPSSLWTLASTVASFAPNLQYRGSSQAAAWALGKTNLERNCSMTCLVVSIRIRQETETAPGIPPILDAQETDVVWGFAASDASGNQAFVEIIDRNGSYEPLSDPEPWEAFVGSGPGFWTFDTNMLQPILDIGAPHLNEFVVRTAKMEPPAKGRGGTESVAYFRDSENAAAAYALQWQAGRFGFLAPFNGDFPIIVSS